MEKDVNKSVIDSLREQVLTVSNLGIEIESVINDIDDIVFGVKAKDEDEDKVLKAEQKVSLPSIVSSLERGNSRLANILKSLVELRQELKIS